MPKKKKTKAIRSNMSSTGDWEEPKGKSKINKTKQRIIENFQKRIKEAIKTPPLGEWEDSRVIDKVRKETNAIEKIVSMLSCFSGTSRQRILEYCTEFLADNDKKSMTEIIDDLKS